MGRRPLAGVSNTPANKVLSKGRSLGTPVKLEARRLGRGGVYLDFVTTMRLVIENKRNQDEPITTTLRQKASLDESG